MPASAPEILLVALNCEPIIKKNTNLRFARVCCGLGLSCLAQLAPDKISVIEATGTEDLIEQANCLETKKLQTIIFGSLDHAGTEIENVVTNIRKVFPKARIGIGSETDLPDNTFDFTITGTGRTAIIGMLRGETLRGCYFTLHEDIKDSLPVPEDFNNCNLPDAPPEKWLGSRTIEISQPWLGLLDCNHKHLCVPDIIWVGKLIKALINTGVSAFHFRPSGLKTGQLHELRSVMLNLEAIFAVSFADNISGIEPLGRPLRQIWLYQPGINIAQSVIPALQTIRNQNIETCCEIDRSWLNHPTPAAIIPFADRLFICDAPKWPFRALKSFLINYWSYRHRFFRHLLGIKSTAELINFMRISYYLLDIIFTSERKGR